MDIFLIKEKINRGENVDFLVGKKKLTALTGAFVVLMLIGVAIAFFAKNILFGGVMLCLICGYFALQMGKALLSPQLPAVLLINKDFLGIFDKPIALFGKSDAYATIEWKEISDIKMEVLGGRRGSTTPHIILQCTNSAIQNLNNHKQQIAGSGLFRVYEIAGNSVILNSPSFMDIPLKDVFDLLKEIHKDTNTARQ